MYSDFDTFLKQFKLSEATIKDFENYSEENISAVQNILNVILLQNLYLIHNKLDEIANSQEGFYPQKEISSSKILFEMWLKVNAIDNIVNENTAYDTLLKAGLKIDLEHDKITNIHQYIQEND